jgi:hypothetical protein
MDKKGESMKLLSRFFMGGFFFVLCSVSSWAEDVLFAHEIQSDLGSANWVYSTSTPRGSNVTSYDFFENEEFRPLDYREVQLDYVAGKGQWHFGNVQSENDNLTQLGFSQNGLRFDAFSGSGETVAGVRSQYSAVDPFLFHGGVEQDFNYSGFALGYGVLKNQQINYAQAIIRSQGLEDRTVRRIGFTTRNLDLSYTEVLRGNKDVGTTLAVAAGYRKLRFGLDFLKQNNGSFYKAFNLSTQRRGVTYSAGLQSLQNPLYSKKDENRMMFAVSFSTGNRSWWLNATETESDSEEEEVSNNKYLIGGVLIGAGVSLSSGSNSTDDAERFAGQNEAAFKVLNGINPRSVAENREYGGYVYRNADGSFANTNPVKGTVNSVTLPPISQVVPSSARVRASYHTHAGPDPRYDNENFSLTDLSANDFFGIDGYLGTPGGLFKFHDLSANTITTIGTIAN